jgi:hypothetical protein
LGSGIRYGVNLKILNGTEWEGRHSTQRALR